MDGRHVQSIWTEGNDVMVVDQLALPFRFEVQQLHTLADAVAAIADMRVRGAPLIGVTAAFGVALAMRADPRAAALATAADRLAAARPTAVNLRWSVDRVVSRLRSVREQERAAVAFACAQSIAAEDVEINRRIGEHGVNVIRRLAARNPDRPVRILTHCNAGWLATVDWGTATAPIYMAARAGIAVHVWVDETRPRLQGALTAWELGHEGVPHTIITDNAGGLLMQQRRVDVVLTGTDRVTRRGAVVNKIGTYLKALAAADNGVPFYVAAPTPSLDWTSDDAAAIPIEERNAREVTHVCGVQSDGTGAVVRVHPAQSAVMNVGFDVTPARLITGLITEHGVTTASEESLAQLCGAAVT